MNIHKKYWHFTFLEWLWMAIMVFSFVVAGIQLNNGEVSYLNIIILVLVFYHSLLSKVAPTESS